jgi:hypothetical protein
MMIIAELELIVIFLPLSLFIMLYAIHSALLSVFICSSHNHHAPITHHLHHTIHMHATSRDARVSPTAYYNLIADKSMSILLGRPICLRDEDCTVHFPKELDDE